MTLPLEHFDFNEAGLLFLLVGALSVIREKRVVPYLVVAIGALTHGWLSILLLAGLVIVDRFHTQRSKWLLLLNSLGFAALVGAWVLTGFYQSAFLLYGLLAMSIHFRQGGLGVVFPLMMVHQFYPQAAPLEITLAAAGFYLVIEEVLRLTKSAQIEQVMRMIEIPVVLAILFPFHEAAQKLLEAPEGLAGLSAALVITVALAAVLYGKRVPFDRWVQSGYSRGSGFYQLLNRSFSERQGWVKPGKPATIPCDGDFRLFFWAAVVILVCWAVLIAFVQGRVG